MADNNFFSGGKPDPNAGASGSWDNNQQTNTQNNTQINPQSMAVLQQLMQSYQQQNTPAMSLVNGSIGNVQGQQLPPQAQKAAAKALQDYYDQHAQAAINHPDGIAALNSIANGQGQENQPGQDNNQQGQQGQQPQQSQQPQQAQYPNVPQANPQGGQQQQMKMPTGGILSKLLGMDLNPAGTAQRLANAKNLQEINAGQPQQIQLPSAHASQIRAQAEMQNLQNSGNEPIQPREYMTAYSGMYQKALDSYGKVSDSTKDIATTAQKLFTDTADTTRNAAQKMLGMPSAQSQATFQSAVAAQKAALDATSDFHSFLFKNNPSQVMSQIANKVKSSTNGGIKVGDQFNGEKVVNVRRIK